MFLHFNYVRWKNLLSTGNSWTKIGLDENKTTLIVGANGQGKSTLLDAITFCLYGKPFRKINKPQLVNTTNKKDTIVEIEFTSGGNVYKVVRGIKPTIFEIYENGEMINQDAKARDYQKYLEANILRMDYQSFTQIVVIGNATYMPFMRLTTNDRRHVVESFLDISVFSQMNNKLKELATETKDTINNVSHKLELTKEKMSVIKKVLNKSSDNIDKKIEDNELSLEGKKMELDIKKNLISNLQDEASQIVTNQVNIEKTKNALEEIKKYHTTFESKRKRSEKEVSFLNENEVCPSCQQEIDPDFKSKTIEKKQSQIKKLDEALTQSQNKILDLKMQIQENDKFLQIISEKNNQINENKNALKYIEKEIDRLEAENQRLKEENKSSMQSEKMELEKLEREHVELESERNELLTNQHVQSIASILLKDDGIKTRIIRNYLPVINNLINKYLQQMDFYINFSLDENFNEVVKHAKLEDFTYNSFSEGEKLRIDLAILFTWRELAKMKNSANSNLLILDEVFDSSLDVAGVDDFVRIITETLAKENNTFIISHKGDTLADKFDNTIKFEKQNGFSKMV